MLRSVLTHFPILVGFLGCLWIAKCLFDLRKAHATSAWPTTTGTVTRSGVQDYIVSGDDGSSNQSIVPWVEYSFQVNGQSYTSSSIRCGAPLVSPLVRNRDAAFRVSGRYPRSASVRVAFNPNDPSRAVLEPGIHCGSWLGLMGGLTWTAFAAWLYWKGRQILLHAAGVTPPTELGIPSLFGSSDPIWWQTATLSAAMMILLMLFASMASTLSLLRGQLYWSRWLLIPCFSLPLLVLAVKAYFWLLSRAEVTSILPPHSAIE